MVDVTDPMTDREVTRRQYRDASRLSARQVLWTARPAPPLTVTALDLAGLRGHETIVDVGCGNGGYLAELRRRGHAGPVLGLDLSVGMARTARVSATTAVADAQRLPIRTGGVDLALSMHTLYHMPDIELAIAELRRVVRPSGLVLVATNGSGHAAELKEIVAEAAARVAGVTVDQHWDTWRFDTVIAGRLLAGVFDRVRVLDVGGPTPVTDPAIVRGYIASWPPESIGVPAGPAWSATLAEVDRIVADRFAGHPSMNVTNRSAVLVAR
jgi:SAM-dependent methyltransferase